MVSCVSFVVLLDRYSTIIVSDFGGRRVSAVAAWSEMDFQSKIFQEIQCVVW